MATKLFTSRLDLLQALESSLNEFEHRILAMYNSRVSGIIKDPLLMNIAIDDHMVHRGHAVFDTVSVINGKAYNLRRHLRRIENSASLARIPLPYSIPELETIILDLAACTNDMNLFIRYWISAGPGSMAISPHPNSSTFYAMAYHSDAFSKAATSSDWFVSVATKPKLLANIKSNNYLLNALCSMESLEKGGSSGIQLCPDGNIAEGSVNNVAFVLPGKVFVTPKFDFILNGTTIERVMVFAEKLVEEGLLNRIEQRDITVGEALQCEEAMKVGGDSVTALLKIDDKPINNGIQGEVARRLLEMLRADFSNPDLCIPVPYERYGLIN